MELNKQIIIRLNEILPMYLITLILLGFGKSKMRENFFSDKSNFEKGIKN